MGPAVRPAHGPGGQQLVGRAGADVAAPARRRRVDAGQVREPRRSRREERRLGGDELAADELGLDVVVVEVPVRSIVEC